MNKILFLDIETDDFDANKANMKFIGLYDKKSYVILENTLDNIKKAKSIIDSYDFILTFNGDNFDLPILNRYGIEISDWKHIDIYKVYKKRAVLLRSGGFKSYSMKNLIKEIGKKEMYKKEIDYNIFKKNMFTQKEHKEITEYLERDLLLTSLLWDYLIEKFDNFKSYISLEDARRFKHITLSSGAYAYKAICHMLGLKEEYLDIKGNDDYEGGYCMKPLKERSENLIYLDFASLYPMLYIHANLFSRDCECCKGNEKWNGNEMFKIDGRYCSKRQGKIEELVKKFYLLRKEYKKNKDKREFALKIILNSLYGISAKPAFKSVYSKHTASDCASLARQCIKYAINKFNYAGFKTIYADTDSCFIELGEKTKKECLELSKSISKELSLNLPFSWDEFDLKLEEELDYIEFFKDAMGELKKKSYIYITKDGRMSVKGLDIIKKDCSELSVYIFEKHLKEEILKNKNCKFLKEHIDKLIESIIKENKNILCKRFNIKEEKEYKSKNSIYNLIREKYGPGEIKMIKNHKIGAGKGVKYCSIKEADSLDIDDFNLEDIYKELSPFILNYKKEKKIKIKEKEQKTLF